MSFEIEWRTDTPTIYLKMMGVITPREMMESNTATMALVRQHQSPVNIIIDTLEVTEIPHNLHWVIQMISSNPVSPTGWNIVIQHDSLIHLMASTIFRAFGVSFHFCTTLDEALNFLTAQSTQAQPIQRAR